MKKTFLILILYYIASQASFAVDKINAGVSYEYVMDSSGELHMPIKLEDKLPSFHMDFVNLGYFIKFTPLDMLSVNNLFYSQKKNNNLTPISPMNSTPSIYNVSLNALKPQLTSQVKTIEELVYENPDRPEFLYGLALKYKKEQRFDLALKAANKAIVINPNYALGHFLKGDILRDMGNYKEATREYLATTQINPYCTDAYFNIAKIMELYSRKDLALSYYKMAYAINTNDVEIRNIILKLEKN